MCPHRIVAGRNRDEDLGLTGLVALQAVEVNGEFVGAERFE